MGSALALSLAFKAVGFVVLAPFGAAVLKFCLNLWGRASVGNFELVAFFTSPAGILALLAAGSLGLASLYLELGGLIRLLADDRLHWWHAFGNSARTLLQLVRLGLVQVAIFLALAVPFLLLVALVYVRLWHGTVLNALIILKPPRFWWGGALAGGPGAG